MDVTKVWTNSLDKYGVYFWEWQILLILVTA